MRIEKPIFIVGVGRSGSSIFHRIFSEHPHVAWLSGLCERYPEKPLLNGLLMRAIDYPIVGRYLERRLNPWECYSFWDYYYKGFSRPCRDLLSGDVTKRTKEDIRSAMSETLTYKRNRLLVKITGWPRMGFLHEIFDDAKFIHVLRDGRAVANSMINTEWWWGWRGPHNWRWGELAPSQKEEWERHSKSFIALACIELKILRDALAKARALVSENDFLEIDYEALCSNPLKTFRHAIEFCDLEWSREFERSVKKHSLSNQNHKWQKELTDNQQNVVQDVLRDYL